MSADIKKQRQQQMQPESGILKISLDNDVESKITNMLDKVILQIITDSQNENDEPLRILEKSIFEPSTKIERLDLKDSTVLRLMYLKNK